ncbi:MAG: VWA domain-containing protein [Bacteroidia bacterium]|nr:VWA domain-containing protein [Bacteroidia bacterium]
MSIGLSIFRRAVMWWIIETNNLIPGETALLGDPELEILFHKRFAEQKLQTYDFIGKVREAQEEEVERKRMKGKEDKKGPIIICVDTSGSMHGAPETVAKTLSFAILKIALQERRKCYLISFSTGISTLDLTDFQHSLDKLLDFLGMSFHGGTDAGPALQESLRMLETQDYKKADILMISDFVMSGLSTQLKAQIDQAKARGTKFHSLVIGSSQNAAVIAEFDHNWAYDPAKPDALLEVLKGLRGI